MDYLGKYAKKGVTKLQEGGAMPADQGGAPAEGGNPVEQALMQYAQTRDPQLAVQICDMLLEMMGGAQGAPAPAMNKGGRMHHTPAPIFKSGGKL